MYTILPFRFKRTKNKYLLTNDAGEFFFLNTIQFKELTTYSMTTESSVFDNLKSKFFVTDTSIDDAIDILSLRYRTKKRYIFEGISLHMIVPTLRCNSKCTYCQVNSQYRTNKIDKTDMDFETARKTVDIIFQTPSSRIKIEFQGGEPTLNFSVVKYIVLYSEMMAQKTKKSVDYVLCTNMLNINKSILKFIKKHNIFISTSLDGPESMHIANRPSGDLRNTYVEVVKNIDYATKFLGQDKISALLTVTTNNINNLNDVVNEYLDRQISSIFIRPINPFGRAKEKDYPEYDITFFIDKYIECLDYIISLNENGVFFVEEFAKLLIQRILTPLGDGFVDLQSPSGAGLMCAVYNYDGKIYASDEGRMLGEMGDKSFCLGTVEDDYEKNFKNDKIKRIIECSLLEQVPECSQCPYLPYCGCDVVRDYAESKILYSRKKNSNSCKLIKPIFKHLFDNIQKEETLDIFFSWLQV